MKRFLTRMLPVFALLTGGLVNAQAQAFWSEDFDGGIPAGWTNVDASTNAKKILWTWCNQPDAGNSVAGCPGVFGGQDPFASFTPTNGFVTVDSDEGGQLPGNHISRLTSTAINCSGKSEVFITFATQIGIFPPSGATGAILRVSTDNATWKDYDFFPDLSSSQGFSKNPLTPAINISDKAANQATVYLQWQWTGNYEYMWNLDDIELYDYDPTPVFNLVLGDFFYPSSSMVQPVSQIATDTFGSFFVEVSNPGIKPQNNVVVRVAIKTDTGEEIFADSVALASLDPGVADSLVEFPPTSRFAPELPVGAYRIEYSVRADSADNRPQDNVVGDPFFVSNSLYSKETGGSLIATRPGGDATDWAVGALYTTSAASLEQYQATSMDFAFFSPDDPTAVDATIYLLRIKDDILPNLSNFEFETTELIMSSVDLVGFNAYEAPDTVENYELQTVELLDFTKQTPGVKLDKGARYLLMVSYTGASNTTYHVFNLDVEMFFPSTFVVVDRWYSFGFGVEYNAVARMRISLVTTTDNKPLPESSMIVFPNPVQSTLNLGVNFDKPTDATITIAGIDGRVIQFEDRPGLTNEVLTYQLPQLAAGTYLARIATAEGTLTRKFVVQK